MRTATQFEGLPLHYRVLTGLISAAAGLLAALISSRFWP